MAPAEEPDLNAPAPSETTPPECVACRNPMTFVTAILDPRTGDRVRLFECDKCQNTAFIWE